MAARKASWRSRLHFANSNTRRLRVCDTAQPSLRHQCRRLHQRRVRVWPSPLALDLDGSSAPWWVGRAAERSVVVEAAIWEEQERGSLVGGWLLEATN